MYLEKLPKEDGEEKRIYSINEETHINTTCIDVAVSSDLLSAVDLYTDWLEAFKEHYIRETGEQTDFNPYENIQIRGMNIPKESPTIDFRVDYSKYCLTFWTRKDDEESSSIVYSFIERIMGK
ncbi:hypothetical protein ACFL1H_02690 [Nanoarchaeota archaeon]